MEAYLEHRYDIHPVEQVASDLRYTGHYFHQRSGLHLAPFRAYDANLERWISRDPIGESDDIKLYSYAVNGPINGWDPLGLDKLPYPGRPGCFCHTSSSDLTKSLNKLWADVAGNNKGEYVSLVKRMADLNDVSTTIG